MSTVEISSSDEEGSVSITEIEVSSSPMEDPLKLFRKIKDIEKIGVRKTIFYTNDIFSLYPRRWLNDKIINTYMELLGDIYQHTYFFSSYTYSSLSTKTVREVAEWYSEVNLKKYHSFVFPVHTKSHWALAIYKNNMLYGFDSLDFMNNSCLLKIRSLLIEIYAVQSLKFDCQFGRVMSRRVPQQRNGDDCGVFCCAYARFYIESEDYDEFTEEDVFVFRGIILHEILAGKIIYFLRSW